MLGTRRERPGVQSADLFTQRIGLSCSPPRHVIHTIGILVRSYQMIGSGDCFGDHPTPSPIETRVPYSDISLGLGMTVIIKYPFDTKYISWFHVSAREHRLSTDLVDHRGRLALRLSWSLIRVSTCLLPFASKSSRLLIHLIETQLRYQRVHKIRSGLLPDVTSNR